MASPRITHGMLMRSTLTDITESAQKLSKTQRKLSSGKEVMKPSDDPFAAGRSIALRADIEANRQYQRNVGEATAWQSATDISLSKITDVVHRARELAVRGANDTQGPAGRNAIADEIDQLIAAVKQEAGATYGGRFLFSGTTTATRPYDVTGADAYLGNAAPVAREIGPGVSVQVNVLGSDILGSGQASNDGKLLDVLRDVAQHLRGGTPADLAALRTTDLAGLSSNLDNLSRVRATVGATTNRLETAAGRLAELEEAATDLLSRNEDADMARAIVDYSMQQSVYQSALRSGANIVQSSLLDWLD
jgi:flagellar hook-associated protein 3 FlgL